MTSICTCSTLPFNCQSTKFTYFSVSTTTHPIYMYLLIEFYVKIISNAFNVKCILMITINQLLVKHSLTICGHCVLHPIRFSCPRTLCPSPHKVQLSGDTVSFTPSGSAVRGHCVLHPIRFSCPGTLCPSPHQVQLSGDTVSFTPSGSAVRGHCVLHPVRFSCPRTLCPSPHQVQLSGDNPSLEIKWPPNIT